MINTNRHPINFMNGLAHTACAALVLLFFSGCSLSTPYPNRTIFTINSGTPDATETTPAAAPAAHDITLRVRRIIAVAPYGGMAFVYQSAPHTLATDYYNAFAAPPADLLSAQLVEWLRAARIFTAVTDGGGGVVCRWAVEGRLQQLVIDATDPAKPQAVLQLQFVLLDETNAAPLVLLDKVYTERCPISSSDAKSAADGWSAACRLAFQHFSNDLRQLH